MKEIDITKIMADFEKAREKFQFYEKVYLGLSESARENLKRHSAEYKQYLRNVQELILPAVRENCPVCEVGCCKLHAPELRIYIAKTVGCFSLPGYLLVRYDTTLPEPDYSNAERNLCPFWKDGCILPIDCRSYLCIQYFCDKLRKKLDMQMVNKHVEKLKDVLRSISVRDILS